MALLMVHDKKDPAAQAGSASLRDSSSGRPQPGPRMTRCSRIVVALAALALAATYYLPLWEITLDAPQYPEGLGMEIWINQIGGQNPGDLQKINNLNHYIGMKQINPESIPELRIMPWIMRVVMVIGLLAAAVGRRSWLLVWLLVFLAVAIAGFVDFYLWGYDYGRNLDAAKAIIKVPGMSYQPPLIGSKKLLNFKAISLPGSAGWIAIGVFAVGALAWLYEWKRNRQSRLPIRRPVVAAGLALVVSLHGCGSQGPAPINYGVDECDYCKMTIADERFGSEMITAKGKVLKYDSIECLAAADQTPGLPGGSIQSLWLTDFSAPGNFLKIEHAVIVATERQKSPMGVGLAAVADTQSAEALISMVGGQIVNWDEARALVAETWKLGMQR